MRETQETQIDFEVGKILWRRKWQPTPVFLPRESHGQRSLAGYSPWGHKEPDTTELLSASTILHYKLLLYCDYNFLHYTIYPHCSSVLHIVVCICQSHPLTCPPPSPLPFGIHNFLFYACESVSILHKHVIALFFRIHI